MQTVEPSKCTGKSHTLWIAFARMYEDHGTSSLAFIMAHQPIHTGNLEQARIVFDKAVEYPLTSVDELAEVWCAYAEMELRQKFVVP